MADDDQPTPAQEDEPEQPPKKVSKPKRPGKHESDLVMRNMISASEQEILERRKKEGTD